jgi:hypothetical protein
VVDVVWELVCEEMISQCAHALVNVEFVWCEGVWVKGLRKRPDEVEQDCQEGGIEAGW